MRLLTCIGLGLLATGAQDPWVSTFAVAPAELSSTGRNSYFILEPGYQLVLERGSERLTVTVLAETRPIAGVETRVVEERETKGGNLVEVSRNYFAFHSRTGDVYYFGEEVDIYRDGRVVNHEGAWVAGTGGARFGLMMPGRPVVGSKYYQELAPGLAMDRAEITGLDESVTTPAGTFTGCLKIRETTPLEPGEAEYKYFAPGIGLIQDGSLRLVRKGVVPS